MADSTISFLILGAVVALFVWNRLPVELVAVGAALALYFTGVLDYGQVIAGFGDATVVLIASLFVVSEGLDATGVTTWAGQRLITGAGTDRRRLLLLMMLLVAVLTAFISINGAVAALVPMVVVLAVRLGDLPSRYLMPLAFGASAGSLLALTGTPVNVIVSDANNAAGEGPFNYFEFALIGVPLVLGTIAVVLLFGDKLLPSRTSAQTPPDYSEIAGRLVAGYSLAGGLYRLRVRSASPLIGCALGDSDLMPAKAGESAGAGTDTVAVVQVRPAVPDALPRGARTPAAIVARLRVQRTAAPMTPDPAYVLQANDVLVVRGGADEVGRIALDKVLAVQPAAEPAGSEELEETLISRELGVAEVVVAPRSSLVGSSVTPGTVRDGVVVLAVSRMGRDLGVGAVELRSGDVLLVQGSWSAMSDEAFGRDLIVVDSPEVVRRQAVPFGPRAKRAVAVLAGMVVLLATGAVPPVIAGLSAAAAMVLFRVLTPAQAYRSISWTTVVLIGALFPLSTALTETGAAESVAQGLVDVVGDMGPRVLLVGIFLLTFTFSQLISNAATALIVAPIAVSAAAASDISASPLLMTVTVAAAAAFLTPVATPANLMVMGPAGYRFGDYWKLGAPLSVLFLVVTTLLVPVFWSF